MKVSDRVLRDFADMALSTDPAAREFTSVDAAAVAVSASRATTGRVIRHMCQCAGARWTAGTGELLLSEPDRIVDLYKSVWTRDANRVGYAELAVVESAVAEDRAVWGGCRAAVHHLGGAVMANRDEDTAYVSEPECIELAATPFEGAVTVFRWDGPLPRGGYASLAQTVAELFATPGWVAVEFYRAVYLRLVMGVSERV